MSELPKEFDIFAKLDAKDGFHITPIELGDTLTLYCHAYSGGELCAFEYAKDNVTDASFAIKEWQNPTERERGECVRLRLVTDAIIRYLNTGGTWHELGQAFNDLRLFTNSGSFYVEPWYLLDSYYTREGPYQHIFAREGSDEAVLWEEPQNSEAGGLLGGFIEHTIRGKIEEEQDEDARRTQEIEVEVSPDADSVTNRVRGKLSDTDSDEAPKDSA